MLNEHRRTTDHSQDSPAPAHNPDVEQTAQPVSPASNVVKFFRSMPEYYDDLAKRNQPEADLEYAALRNARDAIEAFNLFVKRNVDESRQAQYAEHGENEAEFVRRAIRRDHH
jgi:hypothetical protein